MKLKFTKCHANGNDFILFKSIDFPKKLISKSNIKKLCNRHKGIGADGLFIIHPSKKYDFKLDYYNCDGSWETLCANGSRCAINYMYEMKLINKKTTFLAGDGKHSASILKDQNISMQMRNPKYKSKLLRPTKELNGYFVDSGARHFVVESTNMNDQYILEHGKKIRFSPLFKPQGINVNFYQIKNKNSVHIKTYEKGVEQLMLSCASGSTAVIFHLYQKKEIVSPVTTISPGGKLVISFNNEGLDYYNIGPAETLFTGKFDISLLI